ncbi:hypothetical protein Poli38472_014954 [Pythium oligandrum]|uniref:Uncharacterized protein n=1 Tax=Pythium oligandrum TaxID=41045 RepID=A0A8K1CQ26_PYTOL|nr:hypothetical protein Poli38472_014954 [Pythium oligandrum]|eukprot:TMW66567.1 hypothetical protein Poli38472_014954 [Pythium oligandrum]
MTSDALVCLGLTALGRIVLQHEVDTTLPFHYHQLALLLASLLQFTRDQDFVRVDLQPGYSIVLTLDTVTRVAVAVICRTPASNSDNQSVVHAARLKSLVILHEFVQQYRRELEQLVNENVADVAAMAEEYTLSSALNGGEYDLSADDGTRDEFVAFQHEVVARIMTQRVQPMIQGNKLNTEDAVLISCALMNAETGDDLYTQQQSDKAEATVLVKTTVQQATKALSTAFPLIIQTERLKRAQRSMDSQSGFSVRDNSASTVLLRFHSSSSPSYVAIKMLPSCALKANPRFQGHDNEFMRSGDLQRVLIADPRGRKLLKFSEDAQHSISFALHVGSDGVPDSITQALDETLAPWRQQNEQQTRSMASFDTMEVQGSQRARQRGDNE